MITGITRMKSQVAFAGLALTLLVSAGTPMLGGQDAMAKGGKHHSHGQHGQVQRDQNSQAPGKGGKHCVVELVVGINDASNETCYRTFDQAQAAAAQGGGEGSQGRNYRQSIVGILYDNFNYDTSAGTTTLISTAPDGCNNGSTLTWNTLSFNDRTSSAKVFSGCKATFYADSYLSGTSKVGSIVNGYDIPNMESFNNRASSVKFSKG